MTISSPITEIAPAAQSLHDYFQTGVSRSLAWRKQQLTALKQLLIEQETAISTALNSDLGKSHFESYTAEIGFVLAEVDEALKHLGKWSRKRKVSTPLLLQPGSSFVLPEPLGVVLIIGAWNYPIQLVLGPLLAALAAGNCVMLKPSEIAENCSTLLAKLIPQYLDPQAVKVIQGGVEETTTVLQQRFDHIFYTGGEMVAKIIMRAAAENLTPVTLELGGKSPCIVDTDNDLATTAARIVWSKWMNAGQTCVAPDYIIVESRYAKELIDALKKQLQKFYSDAVAQNADYGRIINQRHTERLLGYLSEQEIVHGGEHDVAACYLAPTIVLNPAADSELMQQEIFGPILPIVTVDAITDALALIKQQSKPLALYLYTKNKTFEQEVLSQTSAGSVAINDGMMFMVNPNLPFGGVGNSGMGRYHGQFGFDTFSHLKAVIKRSTFIDPPLRYPPYSQNKLRLLKKLL